MKVGFISYLRCLNWTPQQRKMNWWWFGIYFLFIFGAFSGIAFTMNGGAFAVFMLSILLFVTGVILGECFNRAPNLYSLVPLSRGKSIVYRFLSVPVMFVIAVVVILVVGMVFGVIGILISLIPSCNTDTGEVGETVEEVTYAMGVYGGIFGAAHFVLMYGLSIISGYIKKDRTRGIYVFAVCCAVIVSFMLMGVPFRTSGLIEETSLLGVLPFVNICFEAMKLPWLCVALWCVLAVTSLGTAVYMAIKDSKKTY